jgi:hypothetical protein
MALAALIISILAALFTGWQALVAQQANRVERDRRLDERRPLFEATIKRLDDNGLHQLTLELKSHWPISGLTVTAKDRLSIGWRPIQDTPSKLPQRRPLTLRLKGDWPYPMHVGSEAELAIEFDEWPNVPSKIAFLVESYQGKDKWQTLVGAELPHMPRVRFIN